MYFYLFISAAPISHNIKSLPSCNLITIPESPKFGDPSDELAEKIFIACKQRMDFYANSQNFQRIETKDLDSLISYISPYVSDKIIQIFQSGLKNDYRGGTQFEPPTSKKTNSILERAFISQSLLKNYESGFILGPFPSNTRFLTWIDPSSGKLKTNRLRFVNIFCVPKAKKNKKVGRAVFDLKITGYNAVISDEDAAVKLPQFLDIIDLLRHRNWACVLDLSNAFRQWQITINSYCDFAYFIGGYIWVDTSLVFGIRTGVENCQSITVALQAGFKGRRPDLFFIDNRVCLKVYIDDQILTHNTHNGNLEQLVYVTKMLDTFNIPHDGHESKQ